MPLVGRQHFDPTSLQERGAPRVLRPALADLEYVRGGGEESAFEHDLAESQGVADAEPQAVDDVSVAPEESLQSLVLRVPRSGSGAFPPDFAELEPKQRKGNEPQG